MHHPIHYNHVGYSLHGAKSFLVNGNAFLCENATFDILDEASISKFHGTLSFEGDFLQTEEKIFNGDFSLFKEQGRYQILVTDSFGNTIKTPFFKINDAWLYAQLKACIKSFYYQRSGYELIPEFAGAYARKASHRDFNLEFHPSMKRSGTWNAHGGWYDAGDYGKYIVNGGVSVTTLMLAADLGHEIAPDATFLGYNAFTPSFLQPCSLLQEIRFELEFFLRMQDDDGGVFFKVSPVRFDPFISPLESEKLQKRQIIGKSTASTLNFAGAILLSSLIFKGFDDNFSKTCLKKGRLAYFYACKYPHVSWPRYTEGSGPYGDECFDDEFFWVEATLYRIAEENGDIETAESLEKSLYNYMSKNLPLFGIDWRDTQNLGYIALSRIKDNARKSALDLRQKARDALHYTAQEIIKLQKQSPYGISIRKFIWGSSGEIANHALTLAFVYSFTKNETLLRYALEALQFIYGRNPLNISFVSGSAKSSPKNLHHRISYADNVKEPIPGFLAGGINENREDLSNGVIYSSSLPGYSYVDDYRSYASNEVAINWNAPLTALLSLLTIFLKYDKNGKYCAK